MQRKILPLRERAIVENNWLRDRLDTLLPELMTRAGLDMWLVIARDRRWQALANDSR